MKFEKTDVWGIEHALRGMRNPLESWDKSDSKMELVRNVKNDRFELQWAIGEKDLELAQKLIKAGSEHRKFMRQIFVSVDITAPLYWWKEFDTYKVGTVANSTSTMHKLASTEITKDCFECPEMISDELIEKLENVRKGYACNKDKKLWKWLIVNLPCAWLQTRTVTMNYENLLSMVNQRKSHKLTEWSVDFMEWVKKLPYANDLLFKD